MSSSSRFPQCYARSWLGYFTSLLGLTLLFVGPATVNNASSIATLAALPYTTDGRARQSGRYMWSHNSLPPEQYPGSCGDMVDEDLPDLQACFDSAGRSTLQDM